MVRSAERGGKDVAVTTKVALALTVATVLWPTLEVGAGETDPRAEAVIEAVFRQQVKEWLDTAERARGTVVCLAVDPGGAPQSVDREYMGRFGREPAVRRAAECEARAMGAVERDTRKPAIIVTAGPIEWVAEDEAWVTVAYFRTKMQSSLRTYRVVREREGWISLGQIIKDSPA
jgi:hypothetical protein